MYSLYTKSGKSVQEFSKRMNLLGKPKFEHNSYTGFESITYKQNEVSHVHGFVHAEFTIVTAEGG